jgi:hypothetical protein
MARSANYRGLKLGESEASLSIYGMRILLLENGIWKMELNVLKTFTHISRFSGLVF